MRTNWIAVALVFGLAGLTTVQAGETEQDIVNRYTKKIEKNHKLKTSWFSTNFTINRFNRDNDYNKFTLYQNTYMANGGFKWLNTGRSIGADFGIMVQKRMAWTVGGEYWLKLGQTLNGTFAYAPPAAAVTSVTNPSSKISVLGVTTGLQYFLFNGPSVGANVGKPSIRVTGTVGYYHATWDLWEQYQNLNLSTSTPAGVNAQLSGNSAGFTIGLGGDYPLKFWGLSLGADMNYLYLNFKKIAWYNTANEEVVATYGDTPGSRVVLGLSGLRGKIELKKYFTWW